MDMRPHVAVVTNMMVVYGYHLRCFVLCEQAQGVIQRRATECWNLPFQIAKDVLYRGMGGMQHKISRDVAHRQLIGYTHLVRTYCCLLFYYDAKITTKFETAKQNLKFLQTFSFSNFIYISNTPIFHSLLII